ncbi:hypothetical protein K504DRAFT_459147 [Pleomassaria siparia CBS 279.74]|uniref:Inclusion body clearance protein IML2 n=1 Tax=Pleomassaria siparia CBS 279.74 TaxID=1314801 RepID=A0A6G1K2X3_9PLEO|nr:hypothetical protein K504DRAFT_459147 [Pleomassaria siparia CBS 279.74]
MLKVGGWLGGRKPHGQTRSLNALDELAQIDDAMAAVAYIMNDDVDAAEEHLSKGNSPFHMLGKGVVTFMRATLGFEQEIMREASQTLADAENSAYESQRRAYRTPHAYQSPIYPPGTEYAVCQAQAQLMSAIVGVLNESLTEAIKSFYKLRKAFSTLESVMQVEKKYFAQQSTSSLNSTDSDTSSRPGSRTVLSTPITLEAKSATAPTSSVNKTEKVMEKGTDKEVGKDEDDEGDLDFVDANEDHQGAEPTLKDSIPDAIDDFEELTLADTVRAGEDISLFGDHPVDVFITSGSNFCFGILLLLISLVPPAFSTLLKIVGFKGDRERGVQMLWQASKFHNIHGAMAGLVLFGFYQVVGFCDIIPRTGEGSYPKARCTALLADMRQRYPTSHLWLIEEARMLANKHELEASVEFMQKTSESKLKQLEALRWFEMSMNMMYLHDYEGASTGFQKCVALNSWSHGMYYYICGCAHVQLYRESKTVNPKEAAIQKEKAETFFKMVAPNTGKKRFMSKPMPFDLFINRKVTKWETRAREWGCDFVDAIGVSPIEEMIYFWNGAKKMRNDHLQKSLDNLDWSESTENPYWSKEDLDEKGILAALRAAALRSMGDTVQSKQILQSEILAHDRALFKGPNKDAWTAPVARYEMAANLWKEADRDARPEEHGKVLEECKTWLEEVSKWETYDLDARVGMKVTTAKATLRRYGLEI